MFTTQEESYLKGIISSYYNEGYIYYLAHTVNESDNNYDIYIYFSKEPIEAVNSNIFNLKDAIFIKIDSSSRNDNNYNPSTHSRTILSNNSLTDVITINEAEFIYTNAEVNYSTSTLVINPDVSMTYFNSCDYSLLAVNSIMLVIIFVFIFISNILRIRK